MPFFALHTWQHWPHPRKVDFLTGRGVPKLLALTGASIVFGKAANLLAEAQATEAMPRRFTGSRGFGMFSGNKFPTTGEGMAIVDLSKWQLVIGR